MYPSLIPADAVTAAMQLVICFFSVITACAGFLFATRG
jgi:hypothetical protein